MDYWDQMENEREAKSVIWECTTCHQPNEMELDACMQCNEPKILAQLATDWSCTRCTFDNSQSDTICFMCGDTAPSQIAFVEGRQSQCGIPGCNKIVSHYGFCSKSHFDLAVEKKILPPSEDGIEVVFCGNSGDYTAHLLRNAHPRHASVKNQFLKSWAKFSSGMPRVERVYWIRMNPNILERFNLVGKVKGNVVRRFHGTSQDSSCYFGMNPSKPPCSNTSCRVCSICRSGFDLSHVTRGAGGQAWAHQTRTLRYGEGMYFSRHSGKSNDYNSQRIINGGRRGDRVWKCMFLCNVALGNTYITNKGYDEMPKEFDSLTGVPGGSGPDALNYEECVVYDESQAIPSYLIVYSLKR